VKRFIRQTSALSFGALLTLCAAAANAEPKYDNLVDVKSIDPTIMVELRYGTARNLTGRALYPPATPALVRPAIAERLVKVQRYLRPQGYRLKIWDAYRPMAVQMELWRATQNAEFVADPQEGDGSLHTWGVAVDVTLVDSKGQEVAMPTGFDEFTPAAKLRYSGDDPAIRLHIKVLHDAMNKGGFVGEINEWWHFVASDWKKYAPIREARKISD
jgi:D-alanyl-D-alanine dipeptidase